MKKNNKKAQAAMEFLMTYGWAILVVLAAIGGLSYFGVFQYTKIVPEYCILSTAISCEDYVVDSDSATLVLRNGQGSGLTINSVVLGDCSENMSVRIDYGQAVTVVLTGCSHGTVGTSFKEDLTVYYKSDISELQHHATGSVIAIIQ